ncbi:MAG: hypothetical protein ACFFD4_09715 [Candidatus Odinarchaeota archaeon]
MKARSPETGLDQEEITALTGKSLSTVSRALNKACDMKYCDYIEKMNEIYRLERKYYVKTSFRELVIDRLTKTGEESRILQEKIDSIRGRIKEDEKEKNRDLLEHFERLYRQADQLIELNREILELSNKFFKD